MKKTTIISLVTATLMFTACGEETKKAVDEINKTKVAEAVKKDTVSAFEEAKTKMTEAAAAADGPDGAAFFRAGLARHADGSVHGDRPAP